MNRTDEIYRKQLEKFFDKYDKETLKKYFVDLVIKHNQYKNIIENELRR